MAKPKARLTLAKARQMVTKELRNQGLKVMHFTTKEITDCAKELMKHENKA